MKLLRDNLSKKKYIVMSLTGHRRYGPLLHTTVFMQYENNPRRAATLRKLNLVDCSVVIVVYRTIEKLEEISLETSYSFEVRLLYQSHLFSLNFTIF